MGLPSWQRPAREQFEAEGVLVLVLDMLSVRFLLNVLRDVNWAIARVWVLGSGGVRVVRLRVRRSSFRDWGGDVELPKEAEEQEGCAQLVTTADRSVG